MIRFCVFNAVLLVLTAGGALAQLSLKTSIDKARAPIGSELTIRIVLTNTSQKAAVNLTLRDSLSPALTVQPNSIAIPPGTLFSAPGLPDRTGLWTIARLDPGQSITLSFRATVTDIGVAYHTATGPGITAKTCATVPVLVCSGDEYAFEITAPDNDGEHGWERLIDGKTFVLPNQRGKTLLVSSPGAYRTVLATGQPCTEGACCPFVIESVADVPTYNLTTASPTCSGTAVPGNGTLRLAGPVSTTGLTFQLASGGRSFESGNLLTPKPQSMPATGLLSINLMAGTYRVRVFNTAGCFRDDTTTVAPVNCNNCPPPTCVPFVIRQTKRRAG